MMGHSPASIEDALAELALCAIETTGFRADAISHEALARVLRKELATGSAPEQVGADARQRDPRLVRALHQSISVGETFFFRQPEQFAFLADHVRGQSNVDGRGVRAWSAGCATGEEAYSLSATLLDATVPGDRALPSVIGTDLVERNVLVARLGVYRPWSVRSSAPVRGRVFRSEEGPLYRVAERVQGVTRFETRNLLHGAPMEFGPFDVILCRNVLVYFSTIAAREVCRHLIDALAPGGVLLFGTMDLVEPPSMLEPVGPSELQIFRSRPRASAPAHRPEVKAAPPPPPPPPIPSPVPPTPLARTDPAIAHLSALDLIERGEYSRADQALRALQEAAPDYLPGLLERALLCSRLGQEDAGRDLMRQVLRLASGLALAESVEGPEVLPVRFYIDSAEAFLERAG